jgi:hypothetical protein
LKLDDILSSSHANLTAYTFQKSGFEKRLSLQSNCSLSTLRVSHLTSTVMLSMVWVSKSSSNKNYQSDQKNMHPALN